MGCGVMRWSHGIKVPPKLPQTQCISTSSHYRKVKPKHSIVNLIYSLWSIEMNGNKCHVLLFISEVCPIPCSAHSVCVAGRCQCEEGWEGTTCDKQACHPICEEHGECRDGQCVCQPGWEGEHCTIGMSE